MLKKWDVTIPALTGDAPRKAYIYLPEYYDEDPNRRFPVMYMLDGQNIFLDEDASFGKSWGMYDFMKWTRKPLIIVAVECNRFGERFNEYTPVSYENREHGYIKSKGRLFMNWLIHDLKPYIDANYRTLPDRKNTIIAGSSMGGLMAIFAAVRYNQWFSKAGCVSSAIGFCKTKILEEIKQTPISADTRMYLSWGTKEAWGLEDVWNEDRTSKTYKDNLAVANKIKKYGAQVKMRCQVGGGHCEADWEKLVPEFMHFLWME